MSDDKEFMQMRKKRRAFIFPFILLGIFGGSAIVMLLWNAILPDVIYVNTITYWQAMGLLVLCKILFGGFGRRGGGPPWAGRRFEGQQRLRNRWMHMSEEERTHFKEEWKRRCEGWNKDK